MAGILLLGAIVGYDVILLAGQSNMAGRGAEGTRDATPTNLRQYSCYPLSSNYKTIMTGSDPLEHEEGANDGQIGPGHSFAVQYMTNNPGRRVLLVPCAEGATSLVLDTAPWAVGNRLNEFAVARANEAVVAAKALYSTSRFIGVAWCQGEWDNGATQVAYAAALDALIADFRTRITGASNSWFAVLGMPPGYMAAGYSIPVNAAHVATPGRVSRSTFTAGPVGQDDGLHYNGVAQRILGPNAANSLIGL